MEICAKCPMRDERYESSNQADKNRIRDLMLANERKADFIMYLFDESEHCDHITYNEAWEEFEQWENKKFNSEQNVQVCDATEADSKSKAD